MENNFRTRLWGGNTSTLVQYRNDDECKVWLHCNMGWIPVGNAPTNNIEAQEFAAKVAKGYNLEELSQEIALSFAEDEGSM